MVQAYAHETMTAVEEALGLLLQPDPAFVRVVLLSLGVSLTAAGLGGVLGLPLGALLALSRFPGRSAIIVAANALLGLPPVVVGLGLYLLLSRAGPLGGLGLLFTPGAMIAAQFLLALPIVVALSHRAMDGVWREFGDELQVAGARRWRSVAMVLAIGRRDGMTAVLAGFGRCLSEVGAILMVGGNIAGHTRTMTTSITLETSQGHFAVALALGAVLLSISLVVSGSAFWLERRARRLVLAALIGLAVLPGAARAETLVLASTTSVENSGLLARILPAFTATSGIEVKVVALGTGQALALAARGDADLVLVHDPEAEAAFMAGGHGLTRTEIAWNDFLIVGPATDPAAIGGMKDTVAALTRIAGAGAPFVSRGDRSGTHALELRLWREAGIAPAGAWYRDIGGGMGAALNAAAAMEAYTLTDRGTWLGYGGQERLRPVVEGDRRLLNRYDVILLDPARHPQAKHEAARRLAEWLGSAAGQEAIAIYRIGGQVLFHPVAEPKP